MNSTKSPIVMPSTQTGHEALNLETPVLQLTNGSIRTVQYQNDLWPVAKDCFNALGLSWNGARSLESISEKWARVVKLTTRKKDRNGKEITQEVDTWVINEKALMKIAFRSNKPEAEDFTDKVCEFLSEYRKGTTQSIARPEAKPRLQFPTEMVMETKNLVDFYRITGLSKKEAGSNALGIISEKYGFELPILPKKRKPRVKVKEDRPLAIDAPTERYLTVSEIGARVEDGGLSGRAVNNDLHALGYQIKNAEGHWSMTAKGRLWGRMGEVEKLHSTGIVEQLKWREGIINQVWNVV